MSMATREVVSGSAGAAQLVTRRRGGSLSSTLPTMSGDLPGRRCSQGEPTFQSETFSRSQ